MHPVDDNTACMMWCGVIYLAKRQSAAWNGMHYHSDDLELLWSLAIGDLPITADIRFKILFHAMYPPLCPNSLSLSSFKITRSMHTKF